MTIKEIRELTEMSRPEFCKQYYNIPVNSLRDWEQGLRKCPDYVMKLLEFKVKNDLENTSQ